MTVTAAEVCVTIKNTLSVVDENLQLRQCLLRSNINKCRAHTCLQMYSIPVHNTMPKFQYVSKRKRHQSTKRNSSVIQYSKTL